MGVWGEGAWVVVDCLGCLERKCVGVGEIMGESGELLCLILKALASTTIKKTNLLVSYLELQENFTCWHFVGREKT